jgi:hypothetical protein
LAVVTEAERRPARTDLDAELRRMILRALPDAKLAQPAPCRRSFLARLPMPALLASMGALGIAGGLLLAAVCR